MKNKATKDQPNDNKASAVEAEASHSIPKKGVKKALFDQSIVNDVPVTLNAFLGNAKMTVADLMGLKDGSIITLDSNLNHRAELRLNDKVVGHGEIVAVGDNFGIRITEVSD